MMATLEANRISSNSITLCHLFASTLLNDVNQKDGVTGTYCGDSKPQKIAEN